MAAEVDESRVQDSRRIVFLLRSDQLGPAIAEMHPPLLRGEVDIPGQVALRAHRRSQHARGFEQRAHIVPLLRRHRGQDAESDQIFSLGTHEQPRLRGRAFRRPEQDVSADQNSWREIRQHLIDVVGRGLPREDQLHPRMDELPRARLLPELEHRNEALMKVDGGHVVGVEIRVGTQFRQHLLVVGRRTGLELDGGMEGIEPLREHLPAPVHRLGSLGTRRRPALQVIPGGRVHTGDRIVEERAQVVVQQVVGTGHRLGATKLQARARDDGALTQAGDGGPEELGILGGAAAHHVPGSGDHVHLDDVVSL